MGRVCEALSVVFEVHHIGMKLEREWSLSNKLLRNVFRLPSLKHFNLSSDIFVKLHNGTWFLSVQAELRGFSQAATK